MRIKLKMIDKDNLVELILGIMGSHLEPDLIPNKDYKVIKTAKLECPHCNTRDIGTVDGNETEVYYVPFRDANGVEHQHDENHLSGKFTCNQCGKISDFKGVSGYCKICKWPDDPDYRNKCPSPTTSCYDEIFGNIRKKRKRKEEKEERKEKEEKDKDKKRKCINMLDTFFFDVKKKNGTF